MAARGERVAEWRQEVDALDPPPAAVVEVPLLFESGMEAVFDATIAVVADEGVREERAGARGHAAVAERAGRQLSQEEKAQRADFTVRNDGTLEELKETLSRVLAKLDPGEPMSSHARPQSRPPPPARQDRGAGGALPWPRCLLGGRAPSSSPGSARSTRPCARSRSRCATTTSSASRPPTRTSTRR